MDDDNESTKSIDLPKEQHPIDCNFCQLRQRYSEDDKKKDDYLNFVMKKFMNKTLKTNIGDFKLEKNLAKGGEAIVFETFDEQTNTRIIAKIGDCKNEIDILTQAKSDGILNMIDHGKTNTKFKNIDPVYYILFPMMCCCLDELTNKELAIVGILQIAKTIDDLHNQKIIHCDISPSNVMVSSDVNGINFVLIDFGMASFHKHNLTVSSRYKNEGNLDFMSREQHVGFKDKPFKSDYQNYFYSLYSLFEKLPWRQQRQPSEIHQMKLDFSPRYFRSFYKKIMNLEFGGRINLYEETKIALMIDEFQ